MNSGLLTIGLEALNDEACPRHLGGDFSRNDKREPINQTIYVFTRGINGSSSVGKLSKCSIVAVLYSLVSKIDFGLKNILFIANRGNS